MSTTSNNPDSGGGNAYQLGPVHPNTKSHASYETKPSTVYSDYRDSSGDVHARRDSGGGYERWRSYEHSPTSARQSKEDVYVPVHRLAAVAWCYPDDMSMGDILAHMDGRDIHHTTEVEWCNFGDSPNFEVPGLQVCDHGRHSEVTQAEMRAFAEDAKRNAQRGQVVVEDPDREEVCSDCGASEGPTATTESLEGSYCLECVTEKADDGDVIEVL